MIQIVIYIENRETSLLLFLFCVTIDFKSESIAVANLKTLVLDYLHYASRCSTATSVLYLNCNIVALAAGCVRVEQKIKYWDKSRSKGWSNFNIFLQLLHCIGISAITGLNRMVDNCYYSLSTTRKSSVPAKATLKKQK